MRDFFIFLSISVIVGVLAITLFSCLDRLETVDTRLDKLEEQLEGHTSQEAVR